MWFKDKKNLTSFLTKIIILCLLLFCVYYFLLLRPRLAEAEALAEIESTIAGLHLNLVQSRTSLAWLTKLNYKSPGFAEEKEKILTEFAASNEAGLMEKLADLPKIKTAPELTEKFESIRKKNDAIFTEQKELISTLTEFSSLTKNIFLYNPEIDLGSLDIIAQQEELMTRVETAKDALALISKNLENSKNFSGNGLLIANLHESSHLLQKLMTYLELKNFRAAQEERKEFSDQFTIPQKTARDMELALLHSVDSIKIATRQTNLIMELDSLLEDINRFQREPRK